MNHQTIKSIFYLLLYLLILTVITLNLSQTISKHHEEELAFISLGFLGIWRYSWWLIHLLRSQIYTHFVFSNYRKKVDQLWRQGWRPPCLFFMMTTFQELSSTTEIVLQSIINECEKINVPVKLFIGTGTDLDEKIIMDFFAKQEIKFPFILKLVRQKQPGKRFAIGETLRVMVKDGFGEDDLVIFMDGDTYFENGCLRKCLPFFQILPKLQALTTHEKCIVINGPSWIKKWLDMRFLQRDLSMRSHSLSKKILTLTGRMSIFRGKYLLEPGFVEIIENDSLKHWLWGEYRFLSGDDKSTWYYLLKHKAQMIYVPDATSVTIEYIKGSALDRMKENLRRWSGNTLRNGARAMALGPRTVGYFIWWCLVDQRCAIWTLFVGHSIILVLTFTKGFVFLGISLLWIAFSRLCMGLILSVQARRIEMSFPFLIYLNQLISSLVKMYILFRLPQQRWKNRGQQQSGFEQRLPWKLRGFVASYLMIFYSLFFLLIILVYLDLVSFPTLSDIKTLF